jgi:hypothetical protein
MKTPLSKILFAGLVSLAIGVSAASAQVLSIDINDRTDSPNDTQSGFDVLRIDSGGATR